MVHCFMGFPGDGKTNSLLSFCCQDQAENKIIIYDDDYVIGHKSRMDIYSDISGIRSKIVEEITPQIIMDEAEAGNTVFIDTCIKNTFQFYQDLLKSLLEVNSILVIDAMRLLYTTDMILHDYDSIIITKIDLLRNTDELLSIVDRIPEAMNIYITDGPRIPASLRKISNKEDFRCLRIR